MKRGPFSLLIALALSFQAGAQTVRIYQTNAAGDAVDVIDPKTNKVVMRIPDLEAAHGVTFSPDGSKAYFTVEADSSVKATDTKTGKILGSVKLSGHPNNITISKDGKYVLAAIAVAPGAVDVIDTATMKNIKSIPIKGAVHNTYVLPDGKFAVAGSVGTKIFTVIDMATLAPVWDLTLSAGVRCMAFEKAPDGSTARVFVQLSDFHGFSVIDFKERKEAMKITLPDNPKTGVAHSGAPSHGIGVTADGKTLAVDSSIAEGVFFYSLPDLKVLGFVKTGNTPDWITLTPDSKTAYIANAGNNNVSAVDIATRKEIAKIPVGEVPKRNGTVVIH
ncbi:MAG: cytochrome D1 domain-containing protein [Acidobacteriota bacterium]